ncbi:MAG TPA: hypothetical protein DCL77_12815 [Prolixibacteraceae bacterium]|jgi:hypothetical protein|nr:hypothetical protein [Prolixibacteraceae bacterium]
MKTQITVFVLILLLTGKICYGDVIPDHSHYVAKCVKITNLDDYPDVSLVGFIPPWAMASDNYLISSSQCLTKGYKFNDFKIFAVKREYLVGKDLQKLDLPRDRNALPSNIQIEPYYGYMNDSIHISGLEQYYKIAGFSSTQVILYLWKEVTTFNDGKPDLIKTFTYDGDASMLYQKIQTGTSSKELKPSFELFPNPANKKFHLRVNNLYVGDVPIEIVGLDGKVVKSITVNKFSYRLDTDIQIENLRKGTYSVSLKFGRSVESTKMVIK